MRSHRTDWFSLVFGLIFAGGGVLLVTDRSDFVRQLYWVAPVVLIVVALCLIGSALMDRPRPVQGYPAALREPWPVQPEHPLAGTPGGGAEPTGTPATATEGAPEA